MNFQALAYIGYTRTYYLFGIGPHDPSDSLGTDGMATDATVFISLGEEWNHCSDGLQSKGLTFSL